MDARSHSPRSCSASGTSVPSGPRARRPPRVGQQHQREQARDLRVVGKRTADHPSEPDRLPGEVAARELRPAAGQVALVEDQVEHMQDGAQALCPLLTTRHRERDRRTLDGLLGAADPLRHRPLGDEERIGDLGRGQPTDGP